MAEIIKPTSVEELRLLPGSHAYLLADVPTDNIDTFAGKSQEEVQAEMDKYAIFVNEIRLAVEAQGGTFNGIRRVKVNVKDDNLGGSLFPHVQTFLFADLQPLNG